MFSCISHLSLLGAPAIPHIWHHYRPLSPTCLWKRQCYLLIYFFLQLFVTIEAMHHHDHHHRCYYLICWVSCLVASGELGLEWQLMHTDIWRCFCSNVPFRQKVVGATWWMELPNTCFWRPEKSILSLMRTLFSHTSGIYFGNAPVRYLHKSGSCGPPYRPAVG